MTTTPTTWHKPGCADPRLSFWFGHEPMVKCNSCRATVPRSVLPASEGPSGRDFDRGPRTYTLDNMPPTPRGRRYGDAWPPLRRRVAHPQGPPTCPPPLGSTTTPRRGKPDHPPRERKDQPMTTQPTPAPQDDAQARAARDHALAQRRALID